MLTRGACALGLMVLLALPFAAGQEAPPAAPSATPAAEPAGLAYDTTLRPTGDDRLDGLLRDASRLASLAGRAPVDAFGLVARAGVEPLALEEVLRAEGWWAARTEVQIAGEPAAAPGLAERLAARASAGPVPVEVRVTPGPRYAIRRIRLRPAALEEAAAVAALGDPPGLAAGEPARAAPVLDAEDALLARLREAGHPLARIADREVVVDHDAQAMDVTWTLAPGPAARFAAPEVAGDTAVNRALVTRLTRRLEDQPFAPDRLERTRRQLVALGVFESVRARAADRLDEAGRLPVTFTVSDRPRNAVGVNIAYETNYGPTGRVYYERRNVFGNAERLRLELEVGRLGGAGAGGGGIAEATYRANLGFRRPGLLDGRATLAADLTALRERLDAYDRDAVVAAVLLEYPVGDRWLLRGGPTAEQGRIGRDGSLEPYTLAGVILGARFDGTDDLLDPRRGFRADLTVVPYADLAEGGGFVRALGSARTYLDVFGTGATVVALRATAGTLYGAERAVPLDKRFYAGGGGSVRGYTYQAIGPRDSRNRPLGGLSLLEGSVELRQRIAGALGMVAFVDAGAVGASETPEGADLKVGVGLGVRYATVIGPLRLDVGVPLSRISGEPGYAFYVGLGQAF